VILAGLAGDIVRIVVIAVILLGVYAFVHAALQRSDAYTAVDKLTKPVWLIILGVSIALAALLGGVFGAAICACAAGVYLADVRPKLLEVQGKSR
jgi:4-amino-4-deoxy-L-arabinose transferase-like glycosyltransferase